jgi:hypothetical protein
MAVEMVQEHTDWRLAKHWASNGRRLPWLPGDAKVIMLKRRVQNGFLWTFDIDKQWAA